jgi:adenylate cyclase
MGAVLNAVCLQAKLGNKERALDLLERAIAQGWGQRDWMERDRDYDTLRDDPRFQRLMSRLK